MRGHLQKISQRIRFDDKINSHTAEQEGRILMLFFQYFFLSPKEDYFSNRIQKKLINVLG